MTRRLNDLPGITKFAYVPLPATMHPVHDVGVKPGAGHQGEPRLICTSHVDFFESRINDRLGQVLTGAVKSKVFGDQVFVTQRQDRKWNRWLPVQEGVKRPVAAGGDDTAKTHRAR